MWSVEVLLLSFTRRRFVTVYRACDNGDMLLNEDLIVIRVSVREFLLSQDRVLGR